MKIKSVVKFSSFEYIGKHCACKGVSELDRRFEALWKCRLTQQPQM